MENTFVQISVNQFHCLTCRRSNHKPYMRGFRKEDITPASFNLAVCNDMDRFDLVVGVIDRAAQRGFRSAYLKQWPRDWPSEHGVDMPDWSIHNWLHRRFDTRRTGD